MDYVLETAALQNFGHQADTAAVQGSIDNFKLGVLLARLGAKPEREKVLKIQFVHFGSHGFNLAASQVGGELDLGRVCDFGNFFNYGLVDRRSDLAAVGPGYFVAVVLLGVVGSGDHDSGHSSLEAHCVAHFGCGTDVVEYEDVDAVGRQHLGGNLCKIFT